MAAVRRKPAMASFAFDPPLRLGGLAGLPSWELAVLWQGEGRWFRNNAGSFDPAGHPGTARVS